MLYAEQFEFVHELQILRKLRGVDFDIKYAIWGWNFGDFTWWGQATRWLLNLWIALLARGWINICDFFKIALLRGGLDK